MEWPFEGQAADVASGRAAAPKSKRARKAAKRNPKKRGRSPHSGPGRARKKARLTTTTADSDEDESVHSSPSLTPAPRHVASSADFVGVVAGEEERREEWQSKSEQ